MCRVGRIRVGQKSMQLRPQFRQSQSQDNNFQQDTVCMHHCLLNLNSSRLCRFDRPQINWRGECLKRHQQCKLNLNCRKVKKSLLGIALALHYLHSSNLASTWSKPCHSLLNKFRRDMQLWMGPPSDLNIVSQLHKECMMLHFPRNKILQHKLLAMQLWQDSKSQPSNYCMMTIRQLRINQSSRYLNQYHHCIKNQLDIWCKQQLNQRSRNHQGMKKCLQCQLKDNRILQSMSTKCLFPYYKIQRVSLLLRSLSKCNLRHNRNNSIDLKTQKRLYQAPACQSIITGQSLGEGSCSLSFLIRK